MARAAGPPGGELSLRRRADGGWEIRSGGWELMASGAHHSEEMAARLVCAGLGVRLDAGLDAGARPRALIGGLGMGYTLRAALDALPPEARVVVAEISEAVIAWNRGPLAPLAGAPLDDPRVCLARADVADVLAAEAVAPEGAGSGAGAGAGAGFDAIVLDVDNGPAAVLRDGNAALYTAAGLARLAAALRPGGAAAIWSADRAPAFEAALAASGLAWDAAAHPATGAPDDPPHTIYRVRRAERR